MRSKYRLRRQDLDGYETDFDWIDDQTIEYLLSLKTGKQISLKDAAKLFYDAAISSDGKINHEIYSQGIVGYSVAKGYKIDILSELLMDESA